MNNVSGVFIVGGYLHYGDFFPGMSTFTQYDVKSALEKSEWPPVYWVHSKDDPMVSFKKVKDGLKKIAYERGNIYFAALDGDEHLPYVGLVGRTFALIKTYEEDADILNDGPITEWDTIQASVNEAKKNSETSCAQHRGTNTNEGNALRDSSGQVFVDALEDFVEEKSPFDEETE
jgi:hypothetical protein